MQTKEPSENSNMGRAPCCPNEGLKKGTWTLEEDQILVSYINTHGPMRWSRVPKEAGTFSFTLKTISDACLGCMQPLIRG